MKLRTPFIVLALAATALRATARQGTEAFHGQTFPPSIDYYVAGPLAAGDWNSDGRVDFAFAFLDPYSPASTLQFVHGVGSGRMAVSAAIPIAATIVQLRAGDLEPDGDLDLVVATQSNTLEVFRNQGDGTFIGTQSVVGVAASSLALGDVDGDSAEPHRLRLTRAHEAFDAPFRGGLLCVRPPIRRLDLMRSGGSTGASDCTGAFSFDINAWIRSGLDPALMPGTEICCQYVARDPAVPLARQLSDAARFTISH